MTDAPLDFGIRELCTFLSKVKSTTQNETKGRCGLVSEGHRRRLFSDRNLCPVPSIFFTSELTGRGSLSIHLQGIHSFVDVLLVFNYFPQGISPLQHHAGC